MKRHIVLVAALVGLTGLTACAGTSEDLPPSVSVSSPGVTASASSASGTSPATSATSVTSAVPTAVSTIPEAYRGHWDLRLADCSGDSGDGKLIIEADTMTFHESVGRVLAVALQDDQISVTLKLSGEGEIWEETRTWALSPDGATLTDVTHGATRFRCP